MRGGWGRWKNGGGCDGVGWGDVDGMGGGDGMGWGMGWVEMMCRMEVMMIGVVKELGDEMSAKGEGEHFNIVSVSGWRWGTLKIISA